MKKFIIYKDSGEILRTGTCLDGDFQYQNGLNENILEGEADYKTQYIFNGAVQDLPIKPDGEYIFNYTTKQWDFDAVTADRNAKTKRNNLLAEGPDRISPMWWSSMTPEEQQVWSDYRQALLDITAQPNYPETIVWPTKP